MNKPTTTPQINVRRGLQDDLPGRFCQGDARVAWHERHAGRLRVLGLLHPTRPHRPRVPLLRRRLPGHPRLQAAQHRRLARRRAQDTLHPLRHLHRMFMAVRPAGRATLRPPQPRALRA